MERKSKYYSKRNGLEKVITVVYIRKDLFEKVRTIASQVYGVHRGAISMAVEDALEQWIAVRANARKVNPRPSTRDTYNVVLNELEGMFGHIPITVHQEDFKNAIMRALDVKERTAIEWMHRFYVSGLIKPLTVPVREKRHWKANRSIELVARRA